MKNIKLIVITILIVVYSSFIYANNEVVEKDGNTTKIKLLDEEDNNKNSKIKLFGNGNEENGNETNVSVSVDKIPKVDIIINNADNLNDISNIENDINTSLTSLGIDTSDILYYTKNVERYNLNDYLEKDKQDENLLYFGVATPSVVATFSNISYNETTLEKLMLEDIEPDNIEHTCSFVSTYNDEYHWQYCTICGESAELLATLKGNNTTKPTDNGNNAKGNINIEAHGTGGWVNSFVLPNYWGSCNGDNEQKTCKCGATKVLHYNKKRGGNPTGYCSPYNVNGGSHDGQHNNFCYSNHSTCKYCGIWSGGDGLHCYSSTKHGGGSVFNGKCICGANNFEFKDLKIVYDTGSEIQYALTIKHNGTYRSPFTNVFTQGDWNSGDNMRYKSLSYENLGDYTYKYLITYTYSSCITTSGYQSTQIGLYNTNLEAVFCPYYEGYDLRPKGELEPPVINTAEFSGLSINTDENGNDWIGQRTFTISGTENGNGAKITIKDDSGRIYYQGGMAKSGNNISLSVIPAIEANVRKTLHIIVEDLSGNKTTKDIYIDNTDCKSPEIISELNYKENWKNKIIFKAEAYEGGVGLTQIALNKNSDFKFVDKIENPDNSGNDIYYRFYVFEGDVYGDDVITPTLFARDGLNHLDSKKILIGKLDSTKPTIENINISNNQIEIIANDNHLTKGEGSGIKAFSVVPIGKNPTLSSFKFTNNIQIDYSGDYDVYALDNAGNVSNKYPVSILINDDATNKLRDDAIKVFNYIDNDINDIFKNESYIANNISLFDGNFVWLTNNNKDFYKNYISYVDGNTEEDYTHYKDSSINYDNAVMNTAKYIKKLIDNDYNGNYYLLGDKFNINVNPNEKRFNQASTEYPDGMYYINHDYLYFNNSIGECNNTNKYIKDLNCNFDKVGKFDIKYCDETMCDLYIHRKAYTNFTIQNNEGNLLFISNSFDLDNNNDIGFGKGIKEEHWYWKYPTDTFWNNGKPNIYENNKIVLVKLEIKDNQNYKTKLIKVLGLNNTFALFNIEKQKINKGGKIKAFDSSYDSGGYAINKWKYELKKGGTFIASSSQANPQFNTTGLTLGTYTLYLQVENEVGDKSNTYSKQLAIVEDLDNPFLIASPSSCSWTKKQQIDIELIDLDAGIKHYQYAFSTSKTLATSGLSSNITKDKDTIYTPNFTGKLYLSIIAEDNNGNTMQKVIGAYHIDNSCPTIASFSCVKKGANNTELTIYANDIGSGIKNFYITKTPLATNSNVEHLFTDTNVKTITSKGHYYIYVIDNVGNFEWDLSKGNVYEIASIDVDSPYVPVPSSSGGSGGGGNGKTLFSQDYLDSLNKETDEPVIPLNPFLKANKKKKDLIDMLTEIYVDWKEQNNINDKRKFDIVDLIKAIYEDFNSSHD